MQGAAQIGEGAPEQEAGAAPPRVLDEAGAEQPLRPRQQAHEREAEDDQDEAGDLLHQELVLREREPDRGRTGAEQDEDGHEPGDERDAGADDAPRRARLAQPLGLDGGDRGEVAGDERQDARREKRDEAGAERDEDGGAAHGSKRASSSSSRRSSAGSSGSAASADGSSSAPARVAPAPGEQAHDHDAEREPGERQHPRDQLEALLRRLGQHRRAELVDERGLDLALRVAGGDPLADERLHPQRDGRVRGVERRLADRADELGLELGRGRALLARSRRGGEDERDERERRRPHAGASARSMPASSSAASSTGPAIR